MKIDINNNIKGVIIMYNDNLSIEETLCNNLRELRARARVSQETAAAAAGMSMSTWQKIEAGDCSPRLITINKMARVLNTTPAALLAK